MRNPFQFMNRKINEIDLSSIENRLDWTQETQTLNLPMAEDWVFTPEFQGMVGGIARTYPKQVVLVEALDEQTQDGIKLYPFSMTRIERSHISGCAKFMPPRKKGLWKIKATLIWFNEDGSEAGRSDPTVMNIETK